MITVKPQRNRPMPGSWIVNTRFRVGPHMVTMSTVLNRRPAQSYAVWEPARPREFPEEFRTQFLRGKTKHAQKLADISQNTVSMNEDVV